MAELSDKLRDLAGNVAEEVKHPRLRTVVYGGVAAATTAGAVDIINYIANNWENFSREVGSVGIYGGLAAAAYVLLNASYKAVKDHRITRSRH